MKLILKIKLLPDAEQAKALLATLLEANRVCDLISVYAFREKTFRAVNLQKAIYQELRAGSTLTSQHVIRCLAKTADAYKLDKKTERKFRPTGSIGFDSRILTYKHANQTASLSTVLGRLTIPYVTHDPEKLPLIKGEAGLMLIKGKWYLYQPYDAPEAEATQPLGVIGGDLGIVDILTMSDGETFSSQHLQAVRDRRLTKNPPPDIVVGVGLGSLGAGL